MSDPGDTDAFFDPTLDPREREKLARLARRLERERPVPRGGFRGALGRRLTQRLGPHRAPPRRLRALIGAYAASGAVLLLVAILGVAGGGPFAV
jgi:hypothetical protein